MNIHIISPFSRDKNLGKAYNETIKHLPAEDWICVMDYDAMFLHPEQINRMYQYVEAYHDTSLFVCYGSRCKDGLPQQWKGGLHENDVSISYHSALSSNFLDLYGVQAKPVLRSVAGFLMLFSKATWEKFNFVDNGACLRVDTDFSKRILRSGGKILLMESIYIWHTYRLLQGKNYIKHLL